MVDRERDGHGHRDRLLRLGVAVGCADYICLYWRVLRSLEIVDESRMRCGQNQTLEMRRWFRMVWIRWKFVQAQVPVETVRKSLSVLVVVLVIVVVE